MQNSGTRNLVIAIVLSAVILFGWGAVQRWLFPPPPPKPIPYQECFALVAGGGVMATPEVEKQVRIVPLDKKPDEKKIDKPSDFEFNVRQMATGALRTLDRSELIGLNLEGGSHLRVVLNTQGASVQQVVLPQFQSTTRLGLAEKWPDGTKRPLFLIPGVIVRRTLNLRDQDKIPPVELLPSGPVSPELGMKLDDPCYVMYHYEKPDDERPVDTLGKRNWTIKLKEVGSEFEEQKVIFETELADPFDVTIQKIYTLKKNEYHIGMQVKITRKEGSTSKAEFRYQMTSAHSLPIEGEWYTSTYHVAMTGYTDRSGNGSRAYEDAREVRHMEGGDRLPRTEKKTIQWTGVSVQYFASVLAVDDEQKTRNFLEYTRSSPQGPHNQQFTFLDDATTRAITQKLELKEPVQHQYLLYQGPVKVRLLKSLTQETATDDTLRNDYPPVSRDLVNRYMEKLNLDVLTDAPMPNALGRFASAIYWTDIVIGFTNLMHWLLGFLYSIIPNLGICILLVTLIVRGMLFPLSRRQARSSQVMSQKMAKLSPELKKLKEKYKNDFMKLREETLKLYRQHHVNPAAMLGGCFTLLAQMPIFMGLYYALQESIFFRLEQFLWSPNLAAPDMLLWWTESIPFLSTPTDMGGMLYLGPFFNILPLIAVGLMLLQQKKMMPVSEDPQIQAQQRMMKWMLIIMALFFYKVAAGLCLYFIASTLWGIMERRMAPKVTLASENAPGSSNGLPVAKIQERPTTGWRASLRRWWKNLLEQAESQREIRRDKPGHEPRHEEPPGRIGPQPPQRIDRKKRKKKR